jgi:Ni/Co efflux regulator RcnB
MRNISIAAFLLLALMAGWSSPVQADGSVSIEFSESEARIIASWYREHGEKVGSRGRSKKAGGLPPGIAKNLGRGKALPPGIAKQYLPDDLAAALPRPPAGYERVIVDGKILLVEIATRVVHDILTDVVLR